MDTIRLVQIIHPQHGRRVALVQEPSLVLLHDSLCIYDLAMEAVQREKHIKGLINSRLSNEIIDYDTVYHDKSSWKLMPCFDHPANPSACIVSGTGLTHKNSALNRQSMHQLDESKITDSMRMYLWGEEGGRPSPGIPGIQPEWFYKGTSDILCGHGQTLEVPCYGNDGGEEPEIAGVYIVDQSGLPWRVGFCTGNEFSDHVMEKKNYLYLAPSKLRNCAIGPEIVIDGNFAGTEGTVSIIRQGSAIWTKQIHTGEAHMAHTLENLEHHHFKYQCHRMPMQAHVHFFGADAFSFGDKLQLQNGDIMHIEWKGMGRALRNPLQVPGEKEMLVKVKSLI